MKSKAIQHKPVTKAPDFPAMIHFITRDITAKFIEVQQAKTLKNRTNETLGLYEYLGDPDACPLAGKQTGYPIAQIETMLKREQIKIIE